jgi:beta-alanine degradation protein BauB
MKAKLAMLLLVTCMCSPSLAAEAEHPVGPPGEYKLVLENESVQVLRIRIAPGDKTPMHDVTPRVVLWLADAHFIDSFADGTTHEEMRKAGDVEWLSARRHAGENVGKTPMEFIAVALKSAEPVTGTPPHGSVTRH